MSVSLEHGILDVNYVCATTTFLEDGDDATGTLDDNYSRKLYNAQGRSTLKCCSLLDMCKIRSERVIQEKEVYIDL